MVAPILERDFVLVKIDVDRMINGKRVGLGLRAGKDRGIPWYVIMTAEDSLLRAKPTDDGSPPPKDGVLQRRKSSMLANANDPKGNNVGFPASPEERAHFMHTLRETATSITAEELEVIGNALYKLAHEQIGDEADG